MEHNKAFVQAIIDRMKTVLGVLRDKEVADHFEGSRSNVSAWKSRGSIPFAECLAIAEKYNVSLDWLILGRGSMEPGSAPAEQFPRLVRPGYTDVPAYDAASYEEIAPAMWWSLPSHWIEQEGLAVDRTIVVRAAGDAMAGTIEEGQMCVVDCRPRDSDGVYLVRLGGAVRFKRLQHMIDGSVRLSNDNPCYAVDIVPPDQKDQLEVIGYCHATVARLQ